MHRFRGTFKPTSRSSVSSHTLPETAPELRHSKRDQLNARPHTHSYPCAQQADAPTQGKPKLTRTPYLVKTINSSYIENTDENFPF